jgi:hypothetical protein
MRIKTKDLYCAAYIVSCGGIVEEILLNEDGRRGRSSSATFVISGDNVETLSQEFLHGQAKANLATFKLAMHQLKGMMFDKLDARN